MPQTAISSHLRLARLGQILVESVPGTALRVGHVGGPTTVVAGPGDPRAEVLPCQHRAALCRALDSGHQRTYAEALGLTDRADLDIELSAPPGADLGCGVLARDDVDGIRRVVTVTTLRPESAATAVRSARTVPMPAHKALMSDPDRADLALEIAHDGALGVTLLSWRHRPHPAIIGAVDDLARAAAAACAVEELLSDSGQ